jgi:hypothetical protein
VALEIFAMVAALRTKLFGFPTPDRATLTPDQRKAAEFVHRRYTRDFRTPLIVLTEGHKPTWEDWEAEVLKQQPQTEH